MYKLFSVRAGDCGVQFDGWDEIVVAETEAEAVKLVEGKGYEWVNDKATEMHFKGFDVQIKEE